MANSSSSSTKNTKPKTPSSIVSTRLNSSSPMINAPTPIANSGPDSTSSTMINAPATQNQPIAPASARIYRCHRCSMVFPSPGGNGAGRGAVAPAAAGGSGAGRGAVAPAAPGGGGAGRGPAIAPGGENQVAEEGAVNLDLKL